MEATSLIKQNLDFLLKMYKLDLPLSNKIEIVEQLDINLDYLKNTLDKATFKSKYSSTQSKVKKVINDLTSPEFVEELIDKLQKLQKSIGS